MQRQPGQYQGQGQYPSQGQYQTYQGQGQGQMHRLVYSRQCPNCTRFIGTLSRTPASSSVVKIDVNTLSPDQRSQVPAVPLLVLSNGTSLVGTKAFEWLKQYDGQTEVESFCLGKGLAFSDITDDTFTMEWSTPFSAFEPVP